MTMLALERRDLAVHVARHAVFAARKRTEAEIADVDGWADRDAHRRFIEMIGSMRVRVDGPDWNPSVIVNPDRPPTGDYWTGIAAEIVDLAADRVHTRLIGHWREEFRPWAIVLPEAQIEAYGTHGARLTWQVKPNLERAFWRWPYGTAPMVSVDFEGRRFYLNADAQRTAVVVANREGDRHRFSVAVHAEHLLRLARMLGTDTGTARRLTNVVVPNRCGVQLEQNEALHILSAADEQARRGRPRSEPIGSRP